jgi:hypothetical protein
MASAAARCSAISREPRQKNAPADSAESARPILAAVDPRRSGHEPVTGVIVQGMSYPLLVPGTLVKPQTRDGRFHWYAVVRDPGPARNPRRIIELARTVWTR